MLRWQRMTVFLRKGDPPKCGLETSNSLMPNASKGSFIESRTNKRVVEEMLPQYSALNFAISHGEKSQAG